MGVLHASSARNPRNLFGASNHIDLVIKVYMLTPHISLYETLVNINIWIKYVYESYVTDHKNAYFTV